MIAAVLVALAYPAMGQGQVRTTHFCGTTKAGGFLLEAGAKSRPTSCRFARVTYRTYRNKWGLEPVREHSHFQLVVAGRRLLCSRGVYEAEVGESVFDVRCHDQVRFVDMSSEARL